MKVLLFSLFFLPLFTTAQLSIGYLLVKGSRLQYPGGITIVQTDSTEYTQSFQIINHSDTIKIKAVNRCTWLLENYAVEINHRVYWENECPWYYYASYNSFPKFVYPPDTAHNHAIQLASVLDQHQRANDYMNYHINITQAAIDSFALEMEIQNYLRTAFSEIISYRKSIGDTTHTEASLNDHHLEWEYMLEWEPPTNIEVDGAHYQTRDHTCEIELNFECTIREKSTMNILSFMIQNAEVGYAIR